MEGITCNAQSSYQQLSLFTLSVFVGFSAVGEMSQVIIFVILKKFVFFWWMGTV